MPKTENEPLEKTFKSDPLDLRGVLAQRPGLVNAYAIANPYKIDELVALEKAGQNRTGLIRTIEAIKFPTSSDRWYAIDYCERANKKQKYHQIFVKWLATKGIENVPRNMAEWDEIFGQFMPRR